MRRCMFLCRSRWSGRYHGRQQCGAGGGKAEPHGANVGVCIVVHVFSVDQHSRFIHVAQEQPLFLTRTAPSRFYGGRIPMRTSYDARAIKHALVVRQVYGAFP